MGQPYTAFDAYIGVVPVEFGLVPGYTGILSPGDTNDSPSDESMRTTETTQRATSILNHPEIQNASVWEASILREHTMAHLGPKYVKQVAPCIPGPDLTQELEGLIQECEALGTPTGGPNPDPTYTKPKHVSEYLQQWKDLQVVPMKMPNGLFWGRASGTRSAMICLPEKNLNNRLVPPQHGGTTDTIDGAMRSSALAWYRLKGCGNKDEGFPSAPVPATLSKPLAERLFTIRGSSFQHTAERELIATRCIQECLKSSPLPTTRKTPQYLECANIPVALLKYHLLRDDLPAIPKTCSVFKSNGNSNARLADNVLDGFDLLLPTLFPDTAFATRVERVLRAHRFHYGGGSKQLAREDQSELSTWGEAVLLGSDATQLEAQGVFSKQWEAPVDEEVSLDTWLLLMTVEDVSRPGHEDGVQSYFANFASDYKSNVYASYSASAFDGIMGSVALCAGVDSYPPLPRHVNPRFQQLWNDQWDLLARYFSASEQCGNALLPSLYMLYGFEIGVVAESLWRDRLSWGTYSDGLGWHCNAHLNNLVVRKPHEPEMSTTFDSLSSTLLCPLDFDMAFSYEEFVAHTLILNVVHAFEEKEGIPAAIKALNQATQSAVECKESKRRQREATLQLSDELEEGEGLLSVDLEGEQETHSSTNESTDGATHPFDKDLYHARSRIFQQLAQQGIVPMAVNRATDAVASAYPRKAQLTRGGDTATPTCNPELKGMLESQLPRALESLAEVVAMESSGLLQVVAACPFGNTGVENAPDVDPRFAAVRWALRDTMVRGYIAGRLYIRDPLTKNDDVLLITRLRTEYETSVYFADAISALTTLAVIARSDQFG